MANSVEIRVDNLLGRARSVTGLEDFGDPWFLEPLNVLIDMINRDARLVSDEVPPVQTLVGHLADRLRMTDYVRRNPAVLDEKVEVAGVVIAHARGGSTLLQSILTSSPRLTAPRWWELITPMPLPGEARGEFAGRIRIAQEWMDGFQAENPKVKAIHPMDPMNYEEEAPFFNYSLLSIMHSCYFNVPKYSVWAARQDYTKVYEELRLWLQFLQYQDRSRKGKKWLLKSIQHLLSGNIRTMLAAFPEAKVLMTHRNMESVIGSLCSAQTIFLEPSGSTTVDLTKLGAPMVETYQIAMSCLAEARKELPGDLFIDVGYRELVTDTLHEFDRAMTLMGMSPTPEDKACAQAWMAAHPRGSFPAHEYSLQEYGLQPDAVANIFRGYHEQFKL